MFRVARKIRVGGETGNTHTFLFGLIDQILSLLKAGCDQLE